MFEGQLSVILPLQKVQLSDHLCKINTIEMVNCLCFQFKIVILNIVMLIRYSITITFSQLVTSLISYFANDRSYLKPWIICWDSKQSNIYSSAEALRNVQELV